MIIEALQEKIMFFENIFKRFLSHTKIVFGMCSARMYSILSHKQNKELLFLEKLLKAELIATLIVQVFLVHFDSV